MKWFTGQHLGTQGRHWLASRYQRPLIASLASIWEPESRLGWPREAPQAAQGGRGRRAPLAQVKWGGVPQGDSEAKS